MSDLVALATLALDQPFDNAGGTQAFRYAPLEWFITLPFPVQNAVNQPAVLADGRAWITGEVYHENMEFEEAEKPVNGIPFYATSFSGFTPKNSIPHLQQMDALARQRWVVEAQDNNGIWRRLGEGNNPARFTWKFGTGGRFNELNGYRWSFTLNSDDPAPIIDPEFAPDFDFLLNASGSGS